MLALAAAHAAFADRRKQSLTGFSIDLSVAPSKLLRVVGQVVKDETIRGTFQYEKETALTGASSASSSHAFDTWTGPGQVFYKFRRETLAPAHFLGSGDRGTVTVRYIVQTLTAEKARLRIDAVFIEDGRHRRHPSDGSVETSEFAEIAQRLQALEQEEKKAQDQLQRQAQEEELNQLRSTLNDEQSRLEASRTALQQLEQRAAALRPQAMARVKLAGVELKAAPFNHAATLQGLGQGEVVTIVVRTPYWYGVQRQQGQRGWIYHLFVEPLP